MWIPGSNPIEDEKYIFFYFIKYNAHHVLSKSIVKYTVSEHDILALLNFSCVISCNINVFIQPHRQYVEAEVKPFLIFSSQRNYFQRF